MNRIDHIGLMAAYNTWMNRKLYEAASRLTEDELSADRGAFFGSIIGTLNHLVVADTVWLKRFATHPGRQAALEPIRPLPAPLSLDQILYPDISSLSEQRNLLDSVISDWAASLVEADLDHVLHYHSMKGVAADKSFFALVMHFFNHQTHHRGQVTTLFSQLGIDVGVTDLLMLVPDEVAV